MFHQPARLMMTAVAVLAVAGAADARAEQQPPPIQGVTGTIATEATVQEVHEGAHAILSKAARLFRWNRRGTVPAGDEAGEETVAGLKRGTAVVVHDAAPGNLTPEQIARLADDGLSRVEGVILSVNRIDRTISVRLTDGTRQTLRLSDSAADEVDNGLEHAGNSATTVVVLVKDDAERVVRYFKRIP
jgi:hypothetical protein